MINLQVITGMAQLGVKSVTLKNEVYDTFVAKLKDIGLLTTEDSVLDFGNGSIYVCREEKTEPVEVADESIEDVKAGLNE